MDHAISSWNCYDTRHNSANPALGKLALVNRAARIGRNPAIQIPKAAR
jgi:hypothetical protein